MFDHKDFLYIYMHTHTHTLMKKNKKVKKKNPVANLKAIFSPNSSRAHSKTFFNSNRRNIPGVHNYLMEKYLDSFQSNIQQGSVCPIRKLSFL